MVASMHKQLRQALVILEDDDGTISILHFGSRPNVALDPLIRIGTTHVIGPEFTVTDQDQIIGYQAALEGPGSLVMAGDFATAWAFAQEYWRRPHDPADPELPAGERPAIGRPRPELDR